MSDEYEKSFDTFKASLASVPDVIVDHAPAEQPDIQLQEHEVEPEQNAQEQQHQQQPRKRSKTTFEQRIATLHAQNVSKQQALMERERALQEKDQENFYLRQQLEQKSNEVVQQEEFASMHYEGNLKAREIALMQELVSAKEEGDYKKEVELEAALFDVKAQKHTNDLYKNQIQPQQRQNTQYNAPAYENASYREQPQEQYVNPDYIDWVNNNSWANPEDQVNFDPELVKEAVSISSQLEKMLKLQQLGHIIGTKAFYDAVDNALQEQYGLSEQQTEPEYQEPQQQYHDPYNYPSSYTVAPVTRGGQTMAEQYNNNYRGPHRPVERPTSMNSEEYQIARNLQIPNGPKGTYLTNEQDRLKVYNKMKNYPASPYKTGSPWRLTIL